MKAEMSGPTRDVWVSWPINLGQFLKTGDMVSSGGEAKSMIVAGRVRVNGVVELRRGRKLSPGNVVGLGTGSATVRDRNAERGDSASVEVGRESAAGTRESPGSPAP